METPIGHIGAQAPRMQPLPPTHMPQVQQQYCMALLARLVKAAGGTCVIQPKDLAALDGGSIDVTAMNAPDGQAVIVIQFKDRQKTAASIIAASATALDHLPPVNKP